MEATLLNGLAPGTDRGGDTFFTMLDFGDPANMSFIYVYRNYDNRSWFYKSAFRFHQRCFQSLKLLRCFIVHPLKKEGLEKFCFNCRSKVLMKEDLAAVSQWIKWLIQQAKLQRQFGLSSLVYEHIACVGQQKIGCLLVSKFHRLWMPFPISKYH